MIDRDAETDEEVLPTVRAFDAQARRRAAELLRPESSHARSTGAEALHAARESAFCLGYKAGVVDFGAAFREQHGASVGQVAAIHEAARAWRDAPPGTKATRARELIDAIDAVKEQP